ncbi:phenylacetyl-CoA ligase [Lactarius akahatsu]|uniref:Phenylacetyl-CoA ligase n=1 Tax=Lactarius akahatsu TaxID=416441 RepID=A0AAD4LIY9_9AGAM|nr:phenylacetyl-CoA ligase [Lactarius akahatsu]
MTELVASEPAPFIPDNLTIPQFFFDSDHTLKATRPQGVPFFIEDATGRGIDSREVRKRVDGLANGLSRKWDIKQDEVVCLYAPNHVDYAVVFWALHRLGAISTNSNPAYTLDELSHQLRLTKATTIIVHSQFLKTASEACKEVGLPAERIVIIDQATFEAPHTTVEQLIQDGLNHNTNFVERKLGEGEARTKIAFLCLSSGTTGPPKAVAIPHYSVIANTLQIRAHNYTVETKANVPTDEWRFRPGDVITGVLPFFHIFGLILNVHVMLYSGMSVVITPKFGWPTFLESVRRHKITHLLVVPPMIVLLCKHPATKDYEAELKNIRLCFSGAAPLSPELASQLEKVLPNASLGQGYGMTETSTAVSMTPVLERVGKPGSAGIAVPGVRFKIVKEDGTLAKLGERGELVVNSPSNALRYWDNPKATAETFLEDGWVRTGDEVEFDTEGNIYVVDRLKELIKVRGFQVAPAELEGHLLSHPDVADVCIVPVPDDFSGELPLAYIVLHPPAAVRAASSTAESDALKAELSKYVSDVKVQYKWLKGGVEFIDAVPKNPSGKLLRRVLRERARAERAAAEKAKATL